MTNNTQNKVEKITLDTDEGIAESEERRWGLPLKDVYKFGVSFYKDKEGKAFHLSYEDKLKLVAYTQQVIHGPLDKNSASPLGVLDMIGRDRRAAWLSLGNITTIQAKAGFVHTLDRLCPLFKPYVEAIQKDLEEKKLKEKRKEDEERSHTQLQQRLQEETQNQHNQKPTEEQQVRRIKDALNAQTYEQFLEYAQQQFPGNQEQQAVLIRQLQEQHYHQYVQQLAVDRRLANSDLSRLAEDNNGNEPDAQTDSRPRDIDNHVLLEDKNSDTKSMQTIERTEISDYPQTEIRDEDSDDDVFPPVEEARMWTRSTDVLSFKETARAGGGTLTIGHGETVTVRVPTHNRATSLAWEFATDHYDIGFGVYFEWSKAVSSEVTIHVSDTDEEEDPDDDADEEYVQGSDPESGPTARGSPLSGLKPPVSIVVPIYRRDCHQEVYAGSHAYPGEGVYLLKFDNTYSLWRSKTLYYKVYYTQ